jgi:hypothetical protein
MKPSKHYFTFSLYCITPLVEYGATDSWKFAGSEGHFEMDSVKKSPSGLFALTEFSYNQAVTQAIIHSRTQPTLVTLACLVDDLRQARHRLRLLAICIFIVIVFVFSWLRCLHFFIFYIFVAHFCQWSRTPQWHSLPRAASRFVLSLIWRTRVNCSYKCWKKKLVVNILCVIVFISRKILRLLISVIEQP